MIRDEFKEAQKGLCFCRVVSQSTLRLKQVGFFISFWVRQSFIFIADTNLIYCFQHIEQFRSRLTLFSVSCVEESYLK